MLRSLVVITVNTFLYAFEWLNTLIGLHSATSKSSTPWVLLNTQIDASSFPRSSILKPAFGRVPNDRVPANIWFNRRSCITLSFVLCVRARNQ